MTIPRFLKPGDTIGITCPAGYMAAEKAETCIATLQQWGYEVMVGKTLGSSSHTYFSGTEEERLYELQAMLDDKNIKAILCGRGGYGTNHIADKLSFKKFKKNPKWLIGFSDITVLHGYFQKKLKTASLHAPMAAAFNDGGANNEYVLSLKKVLEGEKLQFSVPTHPFNRQGEVSAPLIGGNLCLIATSIGTASDINTRGRILFIEDIGEYLYSADRFLRQLDRAGKLKKLAGLVVGGFTDMKDTDRPFGKNIEEIIHEVVSKYKFPVMYRFPVSHEAENVALKVGENYRMVVTEAGATLTDAG